MSLRLTELARKKGPLLQVALDVLRLEDAVRIAVAVASLSDRVVIEAGTPLIKSEGLRVVSVLASAVRAPVLADTKTVDVVEVEAQEAARAGASAYTVMGFVHDSVVRLALEAGKRHGLTVFFDTMYMDPYRAVERLVGLGAEAVELHIGVNVQRALGVSAEQLIETIRKIKRNWPNLVVAVAGGINERSAGKVAEAGADIVVVGSAIVKAPDPAKAANAILKAMS